MFVQLRINPPNDTDSATTAIPSPDTPEYIKVNKKASSGVQKKPKKA